MLSSIVEDLLRNTGSDSITNLFLWGLLACFVFAIVLKKTNHSHSFTSYAPTLLTTLGILGTFAGIISGLLGFNVDDIDGSIDVLLSGLKTAFTTSLAGMALSILYKLILSTGILSPIQSDQIDEDEIGVAELYSAMQEQVSGIDALKSAIGGNDESSLVGQMKLMRSDFSDQHKALLKPVQAAAESTAELTGAVQAQQQAFEAFQDRLWIKLQDFADMMSKSATEQVVQALKDVITDFNTNLTEQFGENFKQLNAAVLELVKWQENYKQQLDQMSEQYQQGVQAITQTETAVAHISEESKAIPSNMEMMKTVLDVNQHQLQELERHLDAFKDIRDRAVEAVPEIRTQIDETVEGMKQATATMNDGLAKTTETLTDGLKSAADTVTKDVTEAVSAMSSGVTDSSNTLKENLTASAEALVKGVVDATDSAAKGITDASEKMSETVTESSVELGKAIITGSEDFRNSSEQVNTSLQSASDVIQKNSEETKQMFDDALSETNSVLRNMVADLKDDSSKLVESYKTAGETLVTEMGQVRQTFEKGLDGMRGELTESMNALAERQAQENQRVLNGLSHHADEALKDTGESVKKQIRMLEEATQHQMNEVMNEFGRALTTISGKFTSDYQQLVNEMHRVTRMREEV
ncbi:hypothetical protein [Amphritea sp. HPY]|uniref:hypothetical protein n=1 Tax=Amphritea sp. HPY TaxID=3421652 RepID=UPI003D7DC9CD